MAEAVQRSMEEMVNELEQMQRVGLFTKQEIKKIVKKRKAYEYKLCRRTKQKEDYITYTQYEINLLALVKKRREALGYRFKTTEIDIAIVKRIHKLLRKATSRFQDDVKLWLSHIEFCKKRNEKVLASTLYANMLHVHAHKPALWIASAKWELEGRQAAANARSMMQRGLRFNALSKDLWLEYFRLELMLVDMAKKRQMLLLNAGTSEGESFSDNFLAGKVAYLVFAKAMEAVPDVEFGLAFLKIARLFDFGKPLEQDIMKFLGDQHGESELLWTERACCLIEGSNEGELQENYEKESLDIMEAAVAAVKTEKMWSSYLQLAWDLVRREATTERITRLLGLLARARSLSLLSERWWLRWLDTLENLGLVDDARTVYDDALCCLPLSFVIWRKKLEFTIGCFAGEESVMRVFHDALSKLGTKVVLPLWRLLLMFLIEEDSPRTEEMLRKGTSSSMSEPALAPLKEMYMDWAILKHGIRKVRTVFLEMCKTPPLTLSVYEKYIAAECCQVKRKMKKIRRAYDDAVRIYGGTNIGIWLRYIELELSPEDGDCLKAGQLYWQALKSMDGSLVANFVARHSAMQSGGIGCAAALEIG